MRHLLVVGNMLETPGRHAVSDRLRPATGYFEWNLLIQDHPDQQREGILGEQLVGLGLLCQAELHKHTQPRGPGTVEPAGWA